MNEFASSSLTGNIAGNIRLLCERHGSIADVCRRLDINRQQFNKYLAGRVLPNPIMLRRLCEFFSVSEKQLFLEPEAFKHLIGRADNIYPSLPDKFGALLRPMAGSAATCMNEGLYYAYYPWLRDNTKTLRALLAVRKRGDVLAFKRITRITTHGLGSKHRIQSKHEGVVLARRGTLFLAAVGREPRGGLSLMTLEPLAIGQTGILVGLALVMTSWEDPIASRVTLASAPANTTVRQALAQCGVVDIQSNVIDSVIRDTITKPDAEPVSQIMAYSALQRALG
jgi:transcriptional regulator with XRE-family HTH domain